MTANVLLAIETSGTPASIALRIAGRLIVQRILPEQRRSTSTLLPAIDALLREQLLKMRDLDVLCFSCGPGSFTGLRIAAAIARMVHSSLRCSIVAVPTLEVIAAQAAEAEPDREFASIVALLDARGGRVYGASYQIENDELRERTPAGVYDPAMWLRGIEQPMLLSGPGIAAHREVCGDSGAVLADEAHWLPRAEWVARLGAERGRACRAEEIVPLYLRPPACEEVYEQRRAAARAKRGE